MRSDWFPSRRSNQILMAKNWEYQITTWGELWGVPEEPAAKLRSLRLRAETDLLLATGANPTKENTQRCADSLKELQTHMRDFKNRYFKRPPLKNEHFIALGLKVPVSVKSPVPRPPGTAGAKTSHPGIRQIRLRMFHIDGTEPDVRAEYGRRIYWGVMPHGGATVEQATGKEHYLMKVPVSGEELVHSKFSRRTKETIEFAAEDSGSTAFFSIRYENGKGEAGPWGPVFSAIIP